MKQMKLISLRLIGVWEKLFLIPYVNELGQRSSYDIELENKYIFIHSISCVHLLTFKSQAAMYGCGSHLGHVTSIVFINFHFLVPESLHNKFGSLRPIGF